MMWKYSIGFFNRCNVVIAPSRVVKEHLIQHGLKTEPVIMSNGIPMPPRLSDEEVAAKRRETGLPEGPHFIYIGRVSGEKSLEIALRAFRRVHNRHPQARFIIVGGGNAEKKLKKLTQRLHLQDAVLWYGHVNHDVLIADNIPRLGDIFITPSKTENQPVSMLEAMSFGLPQIGPCAKGIPELIEDGVNGFLFAPDHIGQMAKAMEQLYTDDAMREKMSAEALKRAEMHGLPNIADQLEHIYLHAMQKDKLHWGRRLHGRRSLQWLLRKRKLPVLKTSPHRGDTV
jgi:glycosyltransferase involved in cell wall biosynthesis